MTHSDRAIPARVLWGRGLCQNTLFYSAFFLDFGALLLLCRSDVAWGRGDTPFRPVRLAPAAPVREDPKRSQTAPARALAPTLRDTSGWGVWGACGPLWEPHCVRPQLKELLFDRRRTSVPFSSCPRFARSRCLLVLGTPFRAQIRPRSPGTTSGVFTVLCLRPALFICIRNAVKLYVRPFATH